VGSGGRPRRHRTGRAEVHVVRVSGYDQDLLWDLRIRCHETEATSTLALESRANYTDRSPG
jgi:hypothetical protein